MLLKNQSTVVLRYIFSGGQILLKIDFQQVSVLELHINPGSLKLR